MPGVERCEFVHAHLAEVAADQIDPRWIVFLRLYALSRTGALGPADALARDWIGAAQLDAGDRAFLAWLSDQFGLAELP